MRIRSLSHKVGAGLIPPHAPANVTSRRMREGGKPLPYAKVRKACVRPAEPAYTSRTRLEPLAISPMMTAVSPRRVS